ncbi:hypothetical protein GQR58_030574 [Nymphon striatum]|nr:hypothetical protein GQR58_030574 [Nymphon striatum]
MASGTNVDSRFNRRITPKTTCGFTGPAAGHDLMKTEFDPSGMTGQGILNQCGNGYTPWGTYLTTEENFNGYFYGGKLTVTAEGAEAVPEAELSEEQAGINARYGVGRLGFGYRWGLTDNDFRADLNQTKPNTHGWMVEIDPYDPTSAMGRFKHEGAAFTTGGNGEAVVYMGDDERFDYMYKFVGDMNWHDARRAGKSPFESGTLYAAKFNDDGTGTWLPLVYGQGPLTAANGFTSQGDVLIKTRLAADAMGATPMDRPEWTTVHPYRRGEGYVTCTNNTRRTEGNAANPRSPNPYGHIIKWKENNGNNSGTEEFFLLGGSGDGTDGSTVDAEDQLGSPDGLWIDQNARMWIQTDGSQPDGSNNQMLGADLVTGDIKRFFVGPPGCEVTGVTMTPDGTTMFINIQHPGFPGFTDDDPITSQWPDGGPVPRPATVAIPVFVDDGRQVLWCRAVQNDGVATEGELVLDGADALCGAAHCAGGQPFVGDEGGHVLQFFGGATHIETAGVFGHEGIGPEGR